MSRVALITEPALPAECVICKRSANGKVQFVDFNASLDYYGAIVICEDCIKETLRLMGFSDRGVNERLIESLGRQQKINTELLAKLDKYESVVVNLQEVRPDLKLVEPEPEDEQIDFS
jgi:hypothetical protein